MTLQVHLRDLVEADLPLVRAWMRGSPHAPRWNDGVLSQLVGVASENGQDAHRLRRVWLAETIEGSAVGFAVAAAVRIAGATAECELEFIFVSPAVRRMAVGRALLQAVLRWARELPAHDVWLEVRASNMQAMALYRNCGFAMVGRRSGYYVDPAEDAALLRCRIDSLPQGAPV